MEEQLNPASKFFQEKNAPSYQGYVQECYDRCDAEGQGAQSGQQANSGQTAQFGQQGQRITSGKFNHQQFENHGVNCQSGRFASQSRFEEDQYGK